MSLVSENIVRLKGRQLSETRMVLNCIFLVNVSSRLVMTIEPFNRTHLKRKVTHNFGIVFPKSEEVILHFLEPLHQ